MSSKKVVWMKQADYLLFFKCLQRRSQSMSQIIGNTDEDLKVTHPERD